MNPPGNTSLASGSEKKDAPMNNDPNAPVRKYRKILASCAECRRSKLKCDKNVPCSSCVKRGCSSICPEGVLAATKGNKALEAKAAKLAEQVRDMSSKIEDLTRALKESEERLQNMSMSSAHALTEEPEDSREPDAKNGVPHLAEAVGSLAIDDVGVATYYGSTTSSEYLSRLLPVSKTIMNHPGVSRPPDPRYLGLPPDVASLFFAFPLGLHDHDIPHIVFQPFLPPRDKAQQLADLYYSHGAWQFSPLIRREFQQDIFDTIYSSPYPTVDFIHPHRLAVFFTIMSHGSLYDREYNNDSQIRERYHALACAAIALEPIAKGVTVTTVQAFFCIVRFLHHARRDSSEDAWILFGVTCRIAQMAGLQYDGMAWKLEGDTLQQRRTMFWELYTWDCWNAFVMGRPPAMQIAHTDCRFPDNDVTAPGQDPSTLGFHAWTFRYTVACLPMTLKQAFSPQSVSYEALMQVDRKVRIYPVPAHLQVPVQGNPFSSHLGTAMQQLNCLALRELNLLYLHRSYFAKAIEENPTDPVKHQYAPSVLATYRSATRVIMNTRGAYEAHPEAMADFWFFWSSLFSALLVLGSLVIRSPGCALADDAYKILANGIALFDEGAARIRPTRTAIIIEKLHKRALHALEGAKSKTPQIPEPPNVESDTFDFLGGKHGFIRKSESPGPSASQPPPPAPEATPSMPPVDQIYGYISPSFTDPSYNNPMPQISAGLQYSEVPLHPSSFFDPTFRGTNPTQPVQQNQPTVPLGDYYPTYSGGSSVDPMADYANYFPPWNETVHAGPSISRTQTMSPQHNLTTWTSFMEDLMGDVTRS